jgi:hypothetical protein
LLAVALALRWVEGVQAERAGTQGLWIWLWSSALLAVCLRLESAVVLLPLVGIVAPQLRRISRIDWLVLLAGAVLAAAALWPLFFPGGLPGDGERWMAFRLNWPILAYGRPWFHPLVLVAATGATLWRPWRALPWALWGVGGHLAMATFDDQGFRHLLLPAISVWVLACGAGVELWRRRRAPRMLAIATALVMSVLVVRDTQDVAHRFYQSEDVWEASVLAQFRDLTLEEFTPQSRPDCALIVDEEVLAEKPALSHFNLLDAAEAESLRARTGCLHWCADVQDARWSSRGVYDRTIRVRRLYPFKPLGMVREPSSGYACFLFEVGPRRPRTWVSRLD